VAEDRAPDGKPVLTRPPVGGAKVELEAWADAFVDAILGPEEARPEHDHPKGFGRF